MLGPYLGQALHIVWFISVMLSSFKVMNNLNNHFG